VIYVAHLKENRLSQKDRRFFDVKLKRRNYIKSSELLTIKVMSD